MNRFKPILAAAVLALSILAASPARCAPGQGASSPTSTTTTSGNGPLALGPGDLRIEQRSDAGYHLFIRAKKGLGSVLLTESTKDPERKTDSFAYRAVKKNAFNGDERRILNGEFISATSNQYFLMDSSPEPDPEFGSAYHVFIPWVVVWGYSWSRSGEVFLHDGTFVNIRAFAKPYADYAGAFADNPYVIRVTQAASASAATPAAAAKPAAQAAVPAPQAAAPAPAAATGKPAPQAAAPAPSAAAPAPAASTAKPAAAVVPARFLESAPKGNFMPETVEAFTRIVGSSGSLAYASKGSEVPEAILRLLRPYKGSSLDLVLCLDATESMGAAIEAIKARLPGLLARSSGDFPGLRVGVVAYKDYFEEYLYKRFDFSRDLAVLSANLSQLRSGGGRDTPEAVYEALYSALSEFAWSSERRLVILVGDAPPHPLPRGSIDRALVEETASASGILLDAVVGAL